MVNIRELVGVCFQMKIYILDNEQKENLKEKESINLIHMICKFIKKLTIVLRFINYKGKFEKGMSVGIGLYSLKD